MASVQPTIFPNEFEIPAEAYERPVERPGLTMDTPVWVWIFDSWGPRHFAGWSEDGRIKCWQDGRTSHTAGGCCWLPDEWRLDDPEKEEK